MANQYNGLLHTKWLCKYYIVIVPKYRRKIIYNKKIHTRAGKSRYSIR